MIPKPRPADDPTRNPNHCRRTCDFCSERPAVLYCRADTARLCLFCDRHVHSANLLSRKHHRSQICDNCSSEPAVSLCSSDNLALCSDCDRDAHSSSPCHTRTPLEGFSGCPSPSEIATACGIQLEKDIDGIYEGLASCWFGYGEGMGLGLQDVVVPGCGEGRGYFGGRRRKGELGRQLEEMIRRLRREEEGMGVGGEEEEEEEVEEKEEENVGPGTPGRAGMGPVRIGWDVGEDVLDGGQQGTFTSLLMMTCQVGGPGGSRDGENAIPNPTISSHNFAASAAPSTQVFTLCKVVGSETPVSLISCCY